MSWLLRQCPYAALHYLLFTEKHGGEQLHSDNFLFHETQSGDAGSGTQESSRDCDPNFNPLKLTQTLNM